MPFLATGLIAMFPETVRSALAVISIPAEPPPVVNLKGIYDQRISLAISSPHTPGHNGSSNSVVWKEEVFFVILGHVGDQKIQPYASHPSNLMWVMESVGINRSFKPRGNDVANLDSVQWDHT